MYLTHSLLVHCSDHLPAALAGGPRVQTPHAVQDIGAGCSIVSSLCLPDLLLFVQLVRDVCVTLVSVLNVCVECDLFVVCLAHCGTIHSLPSSLGSLVPLQSSESISISQGSALRECCRQHITSGQQHCQIVNTPLFFITLQTSAQQYCKHQHSNTGIGSDDNITPNITPSDVHITQPTEEGQEPSDTPSWPTVATFSTTHQPASTDSHEHIHPYRLHTPTLCI